MTASDKERVPLAIRTVFDPVTVIAECSNLKLDPWQDELARGKDDVFACTSRQVGKTTSACVAGLAHVLGNADALAVTISPTQRQSNLILRTCRKMLLKIPPHGRPRITKDSTTELGLANGSHLMALPSGALAGGTNLRGLSPTMLTIEEGAFLPDQLYHDVIRPMAAVTRARFLIVTSPNMASGWAYDLFTSGVMKTVEIKAEECKRISPKWLERERKSMPKSSYLREYCCRWVSLGAGVFDIDAVARAFQPLTNNPFAAQNMADGQGAVEYSPEYSPVPETPAIKKSVFI